MSRKHNCHYGERSKISLDFFSSLLSFPYIIRCNSFNFRDMQNRHSHSHQPPVQYQLGIPHFRFREVLSHVSLIESVDLLALVERRYELILVHPVRILTKNFHKNLKRVFWAYL